MATCVLVGIQWGDEGKGKIIDVITEKVDYVIRFQGGGNAGHTVRVGDEEYVLHLVPSGILREGVQCVIANGVAVDPLTLAGEIRDLEKRGVDARSRLSISDRAQLVFCYHKVADAWREGGGVACKIGTTKRGIGPTYADKAHRTGIRAIDLARPELLKERFANQVAVYNRIFAAQGQEPVDFDQEWALLADAAELLGPLVKDTVLEINRACDAGKELLFEGAQGTWLDIDFGTYPYVTSSNTSVGGACTGSGIPPQRVDRVLGVVKAYTTRVGEGPFPTEMGGAEGEGLQKAGAEFGATTGRARRCGWLDAVACRYACMLNGVTDLAITKLDVLDGRSELKICTAYKLRGQTLTDMPTNVEDLEAVEPVYETFPGWTGNTREAQSWAQLPENARRYLERVSELLGAAIAIVSTGPARASTIQLH